MRKISFRRLKTPWKYIKKQLDFIWSLEQYKKITFGFLCLAALGGSQSNGKSDGAGIIGLLSFVMAISCGLVGDTKNKLDYIKLFGVLLLALAGVFIVLVLPIGLLMKLFG